MFLRFEQETINIFICLLDSTGVYVSNVGGGVII